MQTLKNIKINGKELHFPEGTTVAAAILVEGESVFRRSVTGEPRGPLCGMGICFECRVTINGVRHQKSCTTLVDNGMEVITSE